MSKIGFIGLGIMGRPMAGHLQAAGHELYLYDIGALPEALLGAGAVACGSGKEVAQQAEIVIVMVPDTPHVEAALFGPGGVAEGLSAGKVVVDMSSISPIATKEFARRVNELGCDYLDAPVSGGEAGAVDATLSIMVGGTAEDVAAARPLLDVVGKTVVHVGPAGAGQTVKAANQLIVAATIQVLAEAVVFLEAHGVDMAAALEVLGGGLAGSKVLDQKKANMLDRSFEPGFRIDLHHKDLGIATAAAREVGAAIPLGAHVAQLVGSLRAQGHGDLDHAALLLGVETLSGRTS